MFEGSQHHDHGLLPAAAGRRRAAQRIDQRRSHQLLGSRADRRARARAVDGIGSHGLPAAGADRGEVREPARRRAERAAAELREPARTASRRWRLLAALFPPDHPYHWTTIGEIADLQAAQLDEVRAFFRRYYHPANASLALAGDIDRRRRRSRWSTRYFGEIAAGPSASTPVRRRRGARRRRAAAARGSRRAAAALSRVASRRRCSRTATPSSISSPTCSPTARRRGCIAGWCSTSGIATDVVGVAELARDRRASSRSSRPRRPGTRSPSSSASIVEEIAALAADGPTERRDRARPRAGRGAVRVPAADGRRLRRQVRSAERLQRVPRRSRILRPRSRSAISAVTPASLRRPRARYLDAGARASTLSVVPRGQRGAGARRTRRRRSCRVTRVDRIAAARRSGPTRRVHVSRDREVDAAERPARLDRASIAQVPVVSVRAADPARRRRPIRPARTGLAASPPTCSTRAAAIARRSRCTRRSRGSARSSTPTSAPTRRSLSVTVAQPLRRPRASRCSPTSSCGRRCETSDFGACGSCAAPPDAAARHAAARSPTARSCSCSTARIRTATRRSAPRRRSRR